LSQTSLFLFGAPRLQRGDEPIQVDTRKAIALLAYLAVTGERHSRDALATLWSNCDQTRARGMLRRTLSILNRVLSHECPAIDRETIGLDLQSPLWIAVTDFRAALAQHKTCGHSAAQECDGCISPLTYAVDLCGGDLLADLTLRGGPL